jgi:hypothetical protein
MSGLPREVIKWVQSLDLTHPLKNVKRDFSNGYLIAEIISWYYPQDIQMHSYVNGMSINTKMGNWQQLERVFSKHSLSISKGEVEGTMHCKPGAAAMLVTRLYTILTHRQIKALPPKDAPQGFNDFMYQLQLPLYARSTATQSIKNNLSVSELAMEQDRILCMQKTQAILQQHSENRKQEKGSNPERFGIKYVATPSRLATAVSEGLQKNMADEFKSPTEGELGSPLSSDSGN